ncbi:ABC transporter permease subunit [Sodalis sp. (in: enterobacteria)]|uniref:ABC transporter permease subunit n=1 Tax=Sodalis sp. (in: enterobacteria) TaxID=1898979 RepID=UPI003F416C86
MATIEPLVRNAPQREALRKRRQSWRRMKNRIALCLSLLTMAFGLFWLCWILIATVGRGFEGMSAATFLDLLSAPSIVIGLFVYSLVVTRMQHFSGWAGVIALALLQVPIVIRTTENMMRLVPDTLREAAYALGTPKWKMISAITMKASLSGILTGVLLAVARIAGETTPLLFTSLSNQFWSTDLMQPIANLPVTIFKFAMSPFVEWQQLAWAGVLIITLCVLLLNIIARTVFARKNH